MPNLLNDLSVAALRVLTGCPLVILNVAKNLNTFAIDSSAATAHTVLHGELCGFVSFNVSVSLSQLSGLIPHISRSVFSRY
jgi:hypothetical protein